MSAVTVTNVSVGNNPAAFTSPLQFDIQYQCHYSLQEDLEWKLLYVGSAETQDYDQVLDSVLVGPVNPGNFQFTFEADPPNPDNIPPDDIVGVTVILLTCSYRDKEFVRIGYYVNNEYTDPVLQEQMEAEPNAKPRIDMLQRNILANKPRVTKFPHSFDQPETAQQSMQGEINEANDMALVRQELQHQGELMAMMQQQPKQPAPQMQPPPQPQQVPAGFCHTF